MLSAKIRGSPSGSLCPIPVAAMDFAFGQTPCSGQIARSFALFCFARAGLFLILFPLLNLAKTITLLSIFYTLSQAKTLTRNGRFAHSHLYPSAAVGGW